MNANTIKLILIVTSTAWNEVAKAKCDRFSANAKEACADKAKVNFGK